MIWSLDRELDGDRPEWGRHAALEAGGWTQVTKPLTNPVRFSLRHMLIGYARVSKAVGFGSLEHDQQHPR